MFLYRINRRLLAFFSLISLLLVLASLIPAVALAEEGPQFDLLARSAVLMEFKTGEIIYQKNPYEELPPASISKIMTMLLIMEALDQGRIALDDKVVVSENAARMGGSQVWLEVGEVMTVDDLLKTIAVVSANDSCVALAEYIAGTEKAFVKAMNERAKELGLEHSYFVNTNGLPPDDSSRGNYTCAYDVAVMSRELLKYPKILEYTSIWIDYIRDGKNVLNNTNRLVRHYPGVDGIKTGFTSEARYCLSATGERDNLRFIAVVMAAPDSKTRFEETRKLLAYGFSAFEALQIAKKGENMGEIRVFNGTEETLTAVVGEDLYVPVRRGQESGVSKKISLQNYTTAPIERGQVLGRISVYQEGRLIDSADIIATREIPRASIFQMMAKVIRDMVRIVNEKIW